MRRKDSHFKKNTKSSVCDIFRNFYNSHIRLGVPLDIFFVMLNSISLNAFLSFKPTFAGSLVSWISSSALVRWALPLDLESSELSLELDFRFYILLHFCNNVIRIYPTITVLSRD